MHSYRKKFCCNLFEVIPYIYWTNRTVFIKGKSLTEVVVLCRSKCYKIRSLLVFLFQSKLVGLLDADVYGPSIPKLMNLKGPVYINKGTGCALSAFFKIIVFIQT